MKNCYTYSSLSHRNLESEQKKTNHNLGMCMLFRRFDLSFTLILHCTPNHQ